MLHPCQACHRHIKSASCPFCGASRQPAVVPVAAGTARRHAQILAGAAVLGVVSLAACSSTPVYGAPGDDDEGTGSSSGSIAQDAGDDG